MDGHSGLRSVGIIGQGTAGLLTALALKERDPSLDVVIVASSGIPVIGVGEATTPILPPFLFGYLGLDPHTFEREVKPTLKLGIRFEWGQPEHWFNYAFGEGDLSDAMAHDGHTRRYSATSMLMDAGKAPLVKVGGTVHSLLRETRLALHLDNVRLVRFLEKRARDVGIRTLDATVHDVHTVQGPDGPLVDRLETSAGTLSFDVYVDCTGFRSLLMGNALHSPFIDYAPSLMTDRAITAVRPHDGRFAPYTTARTMSAGWTWTIPMRDELHHGYVFASKYLREEDARAELEAVYPGCHDFKVVRFRSGRRQHFIRGNVVALGNSYGFVEPLESTAIHMIVIAISKVLTVAGGRAEGAMPAGPHKSVALASAKDMGQPKPRPLCSPRQEAELNSQMGAHWDWLRWFLAVHYRFNRRVDSPFWRDVHLTTDWSGLEGTHKDFQVHGPLSARAPNEAPRLAGDVVFGPRGFDIMMLGQQVMPSSLPRRTSATEWRELATLRERMVELALPHHEALAHLGQERGLLDALVHDETSWCRQMAKEMLAFSPPEGQSQDALSSWAHRHHVPHVTGRETASFGDDFQTNPTLDFGKYLKRVPRIVLRPKDQKQLSECVDMLVSRRMPMTVRGAGHSSGGQTLSEDGAVLDLRWLKRVIGEEHPDPARGDGRGLIRVESGIWWLELCAHLKDSGRRPLVLTDNWRSTVGGTLAVGGFGDASHREGLQTAGVRELMVLTLDGIRHRVRPGDPLFDWSLAGRGQLGLITEVVLETIEKSYDLDARVFVWRNFAAFAVDMATVVAERRFDWLRARLSWDEAGSVHAAAGHLGPVGDAVERDLVGLSASYGARETLDLFASSAEPPDEAWKLASPSVEVVLPVNERGLAGLSAIHTRVRSSPLKRYLPRGSSLMTLRGRDALTPPMAPLPASELVMMLAIRPEVPLHEVDALLPHTAAIADIALECGGAVYAMGVEPTSADWLMRQLGPQHAELVALKQKYDPLGLLNPGFVKTR